MTTTKKASKSGARRVTANLDVLASLFQNHHASLGIPSKVAMDFATRCDLLSDSLDRRKQAGYFDPSEIGKEVPGPLMYDENNPFMEGEFTQEEKRNLSEKQMAGELAANAAKHIADPKLDPKLASVIRKAAYSAALAALRTAKKSEETADDETAEDDSESKKDEAATKTAMMAQLYNRIRRQAKKSEEEPEEEDAEEETEESDKTASIFGLFR